MRGGAKRGLGDAGIALGERRFRDYFRPLQADAAEPVPMAEYLTLPEAERRKRTPFVQRTTNGGEARRYRVDQRLVRISEDRQQAWRMLQELAGLVTPFTARVQREAQASVAADREAELRAQAQDYEQRIGELRNALQEETRQEMRERLMQLAGYRDATIPKSG